MPFTKEQRLKGLKKQLANLGYSISETGSGTAQSDPVVSLSDGISDDERGAHTIRAMQAREEAW